MKEVLFLAVLLVVFLPGCSEHCIPNHKCPGPCVAEEYSDSSGTISGLDRYFYDENNKLIFAEMDYDADGSVDTVWRCTYDAEGNPIKSEYDEGDNGTVDTRSSYSWDANGNLLTKEFDYDGDGPGRPWWVYYYTYDYNGTLLMLEIDVGSDGVVDGRQIYKYDQSGCPVRMEIFCFGDLCADGIVTQTCDEQGHILTSESPAAKQRNTYDQNGNLLIEETERDEGIERFVYKYDEYGNLLKQHRERQDETGDLRISGRVTFRYDCWCR